MSEVIENGEVVGLPMDSVIYPLMLSLQGETKKGKTYFAASFPNAFLLDFAPSKMSFAKVIPDELAMTRTVGEGFRSIFTPVKKPDGVHWVPKIPGFDYKQQYFFVKNTDMLDAAIEKAKLFKESLPKDSGKVWLVIDDTIRWRNMEILHWVETKGKWPAREQFGIVTQQMLGKITLWQNDFNVLLIHKMEKSFETGEPIAKIYPGNADYLSDCNLEITNIQKNNNMHQAIIIHSNGHCYECSADYVKEILDPDPMTVLSMLKIPRELW
jgi:hypothetical protein